MNTDKKQQAIDILDLTKDPELAIFKAIKAVDNKVDKLLTPEKEDIIVDIQIV